MPDFCNEKRYRKNSNGFELQEPRGTVGEFFTKIREKKIVSGVSVNMFIDPARKYSTIHMKIVYLIVSQTHYSLSKYQPHLHSHMLWCWTFSHMNNKQISSGTGIYILYCILVYTPAIPAWGPVYLLTCSAICQILIPTGLVV